MDDSYAERIKENYSKMHTDILIETKIKGGLTDAAAQLLEEELARRNINKTHINEYVESDSANFKPEDFPKGIKLGNLASTGSRYLAQIVDQIIGVCLLVAFIFLFVGVETSGVIGIIAYAAYILFNDSMPNGQSLGKKLFSIRVVNKESGKSCSIPESFMRNITTVIPFLAVIDAVMIFGVKKQRLGDKIANTLVINA